MRRQWTQTVLVVDDSNLFSVPIRQALVRRGVEVFCAKSPQKALSLFQANRPKIDMVVIDMATPAASNLDLAAELERLRPGLPILYLVGASKSIARCSIEAQAPEAVLVTPFTEDQLLQRVGGLLATEVAERRGAEEPVWEKLIATSDPILAGPSILHIYELRQAPLAADHVAILRAGAIHHCVRPTNCDAAPYGMIVGSRDVAHARSLLEQVSGGGRMVSAA